MSGVKTCRSCAETRSLEEFSRRGDTKAGYRSECKACSVKRQQEYYAKNKERVLAKNKEWYVSNRAKVSAYNRTYREHRPEQVKAAKRNWYLANQDRCAEQYRERYKRDQERIDRANAEWKAANKERRRAAANRYARKAVVELTDHYVRTSMRLSAADAAPELIELKRAHLLLQRALKEAK